jgi:HAD superfamily hydrolase (TIGR01509 family)
VKVRTQLLSPLVPGPAEIDVVTIDAFGTLVELRDPVGSLARILPGHEAEAIERAFRAEAEYYMAHSHVGPLDELYADCAELFNATLGSELAPEAYIAALDAEYAVLPGVAKALARLRSLGLELAVVGNWDVRLAEHLERLGLAPFFSAVVTSAGVAAAKPGPRPFLAALELVGAPPERALHVGDSPADEDGARAAGLHFLPTPLATVPERLAR